MSKGNTNLEPTRTALIIIDMQNGFVEENAPIFVPNARKIASRIIELIKLVRRYRMKVIWTRISLNNVEKSPYKKIWPQHFNSDGNSIMERGSHNFQIIDELTPYIEARDFIIDKDRYSAFYQTNLELLLRQNDIKTLLFAGVSTNVCVESTLRDAFFRDIESILLSDCTSTFTKEMQSTAEEIIKFVFGYVISFSELKGLLERSDINNRD